VGRALAEIHPSPSWRLFQGWRPSKKNTPITKLAIIPGLAAIKEKSAGGTNRKRNSDGAGAVEAVGSETRRTKTRLSSP